MLVLILLREKFRAIIELKNTRERPRFKNLRKNFTCSSWYILDDSGYMSAEIQRLFFYEKRISLRLWVFKFIDYEDSESFGVAVEGYRPNDQTETILRNWHSTAIEERISSSLLVSHSGTTYELRGSIDKELANQYGYPAELIAIFTNGFPENWKSILKEYFHIIKSTASVTASLNWNAFARLRGLDENNERFIRPSIRTQPVRLPDVITEDTESEERGNTFNEPVVSPAVEGFVSPTSQQFRKEDFLKSRHSSSIKSRESVGKHVNDVGLEVRELSTRNISDDSVVAISELTQHSAVTPHSYICIPHCTEGDAVPIVHSPTSVSSQSLREERSAGPIFAEPNSIDEDRKLANGERELNWTETSSCRAVLPRFYDMSKFQSSSLSTYKASGTIELSEWSIRFAPIGHTNLQLGFPAFVVLGTKEGHPTQWQSSTVTRVESAHIFYSVSSKYRIIGNINVVDSANAGFPKVFAVKFFHGFPPDWRTTITELYNSFFSHDVSGSTYFRERLHLSRHESGIRPPKRGSGAEQSRFSDISHGRPSKNVEAVVRRSRSGRCIHTPLAEWTGQRVRYDGFGNVIGIQDVTNVTIHSRGAVNTSDLCNLYGVSYTGARNQSESLMKAAELPVKHSTKKSSRKKAFVNCSDSSGDVDGYYRGKGTLSSDDRCGLVSWADHVVQDDSDNSVSEEQLRIKRRLILRKARELQKQQEKLLDLERRIAMKEKNCRRIYATGNSSIPQVNERWCNNPGKYKWRFNLKKVKGRGNCEKLHKRFIRNSGCTDEKMCCRERQKDQGRLFDEEWARENEEFHTDYDDYDDEDGEWCEPVKKRRKLPIKKTKARLPSSDMSSSSDERSFGREGPELDGGDEPCIELPVKKERSWHRTELQRLKRALSAIHVMTEDDWEKVSRSIGGERDAESCKQAAIKRLKWQPAYPNSSPTPEVSSEAVTARVGTIAHHHQTGEYTRKYMMGGSVQCEDYFNHNAPSISNSIPDVTNFGADDSLLEAINTPVEVVDQKKRNIRRQFLAEPVDDDTPLRRRSSGILMVTPTDSAQRERQARYFHHILHKGGRRKGTSRVNFSRIGDSTYFERTREGEPSRNMRTFGDFHENLEKVAKITKRATSKQVDMDGTSFDLDTEDSDLHNLVENSF